MIAIISEFADYLNTGLIPFNPKRPSKKAKGMLKLLGLSSLLKKRKPR